MKPYIEFKNVVKQWIMFLLRFPKVPLLPFSAPPAAEKPP